MITKKPFTSLALLCLSRPPITSLVPTGLNGTNEITRRRTGSNGRRLVIFLVCGAKKVSWRCQRIHATMFYESLAKESIGFCQHLSDAAVQNGEYFVDLLRLNNERRCDRHPMGIETGQQPMLQGTLANECAKWRIEAIFRF